MSFPRGDSSIGWSSNEAVNESENSFREIRLMSRYFAPAILCIVGLAGSLQADSSAAPEPTAVERTRRTILMLDGVYKQAIVLITDKYVHDEDDFPAGSAAVQWFESISKAGSHQVRLIDATGLPVEEANVAKDAFEKEGIRKLKAGEKHYEKIVKDGDGHRLRVLTPVPVVMKKCVMCHEHYADVEAGHPIGAISYSMLID